MAAGPKAPASSATSAILVPAAKLVRMTDMDENELLEMDREQARLVRSGEIEAMEALLHPDYRAYLANGRILGFDEMIDLVRSGALAKEHFDRTQQAAMVSGTTGIVMGVDLLEEPPIFAEGNERTRHYTNVYTHDGARWRLLARHFHLRA
jgi:hypothetical protein